MHLDWVSVSHLCSLSLSPCFYSVYIVWIFHMDLQYRIGFTPYIRISYIYKKIQKEL